MKMVYIITNGIPINAIISIVCKVLGVEDALQIVRLFAISILEGTNSGNRLRANNRIIMAIKTDEDKKVIPNFLDLTDNGM